MFYAKFYYSCERVYYSPIVDLAERNQENWDSEIGLELTIILLTISILFFALNPRYYVD